MVSIRDIFSDLLYIIYPEFCYACDEDPPAKNQIFCTSCLYEMPFTDHFENQENELTFHLAGRQKVVFGASLLFLNKKGIVHNMMNNFKYKKHKEIGTILGNYFGKAFQKSTYFEQFDFIVPVPIYYKKKGKRGFNQSAIFAQGISETLGVPVLIDNLIKSRPTASQTGFNRTQRLRNVHNTIEVKDKDQLMGKKILLVDDIITTGATLESCMIKLTEETDVNISVGTIALTL